MLVLNAKLKMVTKFLAYLVILSYLQVSERQTSLVCSITYLTKIIFILYKYLVLATPSSIQECRKSNFNINVGCTRIVLSRDLIKKQSDLPHPRAEPVHRSAQIDLESLLCFHFSKASKVNEQRCMRFLRLCAFHSRSAAVIPRNDALIGQPRVAVILIILNQF